jgi:glycosyltransferase involved in cell wall biosynthesis
MRLGIVADEFFSPAFGRMGGFGWAARQVATLFRTRPHLGIDVVFLAARAPLSGQARLARVHDTPLVFQREEQSGPVIDQALDLLLTVDYRPRYRWLLETLGATPTIVWVRDPRPPNVQARIATLRLPDDAHADPKGVKRVDARSLGVLTERSAASGRCVLFATPAPSLGRMLESAYGVSDAPCAFLPNVVDLRPIDVVKSARPRVIFLGRLDPIKRPWLFVALARAFPTVEFVMLGRSHFHGRGAWEAGELPRNVTLLGHVDGDEKLAFLSSAWALVNTSIHEGVPTSFLEALACETPILSCTDVEAIASRFGIHAGWCGGDGMAGLPALIGGLRRLLDNDQMRDGLGQAGRRWVERTHSASNFLRAFEELCAAADVRLPIGQAIGTRAVRRDLYEARRHGLVGS